MGENSEKISETTTPDLSSAGLRKLRGQYFTVRHIPLEACEHLMDVINEPRHRNCENCWWNFFLYHPQLVTSVDEAWREHGKEFVIRLRGKKFADMFGRFQKTVQHLKEQEKANVDQQGVRPDTGSEPGIEESTGEGGTDFPFGYNVEGGQAESCPVGGTGA
jgi:hypothetical protein